MAACRWLSPEYAPLYAHQTCDRRKHPPCALQPLRLSCTEQWFPLEEALWDPKPLAATTDTQGKAKLCLGTVVSPGTCKPWPVISLKNATSCYAQSEEEASMLGFWILLFPAAMWVCPVFLPRTRIALLPWARTRSKAAPCWAGTTPARNQTAAVGQPDRQTLFAGGAASAPVFAPISMPGTRKNVHGSPVVNGTQKLETTFL